MVVSKNNFFLMLLVFLSNFYVCGMGKKRLSGAENKYLKVGKELEQEQESKKRLAEKKLAETEERVARQESFDKKSDALIDAIVRDYFRENKKQSEESDS